MVLGIHNFGNRASSDQLRAGSNCQLSFEFLTNLTWLFILTYSIFVKNFVISKKLFDYYVIVKIRGMLCSQNWADTLFSGQSFDSTVCNLQVQYIVKRNLREVGRT